MLPGYSDVKRTRALWFGLGCVLCLVTFACRSAPTIVVWEKPGATAEELEEAREACGAEPVEMDQERFNKHRYEADATGRQFVDCMNERGFTWRTEKLKLSE